MAITYSVGVATTHLALGLTFCRSHPEVRRLEKEPPRPRRSAPTKDPLRSSGEPVNPSRNPYKLLDALWGCQGCFRVLTASILSLLNTSQPDLPRHFCKERWLMMLTFTQVWAVMSPKCPSGTLRSRPCETKKPMVSPIVYIHDTACRMAGK